MSRDPLDLDEAPWRAWIDEVGAAVGVGTEGVRVVDVHDLTRVVARDLGRPMAPVSAYLWGLACAAHPDRDPAELRARIAALAEGAA